MLFPRRQLQTTTWKTIKINCKTTGGVPRQIWPFAGFESCFAFFVYPSNVNVVDGACWAHQPFVTNVSALEISNWRKCRKIWIWNIQLTLPYHRRSKGGLGGHGPYRFSEHIVILCFKRRYPKRNSGICLKACIFPQNFSAPTTFLGWLRYCAL